jgi:hypothetical protein
MPTKSTNNPWVPPGGLNSGSFAQLGGSTDAVGSRFGGLLGCKANYDNAAALKVSKTSIGTLYQGEYQLVKLAATILRGQILAWSPLALNGQSLFLVTPTVTAPAIFNAGIAICAGTSGEYVWIQTRGLASVLYGTVTSAVLGNVVTRTSLTTATADVIADAGTTFATNTGAKGFIGLAYELPATGAVGRVWLAEGAFLSNEPS